MESCGKCMWEGPEKTTSIVLYAPCIWSCYTTLLCLLSYWSSSSVCSFHNFKQNWLYQSWNSFLFELIFVFAEFWFIAVEKHSPGECCGTFTEWWKCSDYCVNRRSRMPVHQLTTMLNYCTCPKHMATCWSLVSNVDSNCVKISPDVIPTVNEFWRSVKTVEAMYEYRVAFLTHSVVLLYDCLSKFSLCCCWL